MNTAKQVSEGLKVSRDKLGEVGEKIEKIESVHLIFENIYFKYPVKTIDQKYKSIFLVRYKIFLVNIIFNTTKNEMINWANQVKLKVF
ncbi:hypothetical protein [Pseudolactococcus insecticola]|uniref:Uncharacterized protein n=1 Tax=Pseudolactococcus insecticola TaxID=2709158 RepID=A0A6A0B841_9LACT|nr:hypothetical protein [Lactococcus insecticola]GFH40833.1 hypothetical protein Hs20B_12310 [Lactococcus insecticola]